MKHILFNSILLATVTLAMLFNGVEVYGQARFGKLRVPNQNQNNRKYDYYKVGDNGNGYTTIHMNIGLFDWVNDKCNTDIANALFGSDGKSVEEAANAYFAQYKKLYDYRTEECKESHYFKIDWKGIVCDCYASCIVTAGKEKLLGKMKGKKTETSKALLWNLKTGQLLTMKDVFTPEVESEVLAMGGENYQVFMDVNGKLTLLFDKEGQQLQAAFSFVDNKEVFNPQFAELAGKYAKIVEEIYTNRNGQFAYNSKTGEIFGLANRISQSQSTVSTSVDAEEQSSHDNGDKVFDVVDEMPSFPGGPQALYEYLARTVKYPQVAEENGVQGRVIVSFVVDLDGSITDAKVVKSVDPSLDKEALRVTKSMPNWIPGKQKEETVRVKFTVPVTFKLQEPSKKKK